MQLRATSFVVASASVSPRRRTTIVKPLEQGSARSVKRATNVPPPPVVTSRVSTRPPPRATTTWRDRGANDEPFTVSGENRVTRTLPAVAVAVAPAATASTAAESAASPHQTRLRVTPTVCPRSYAAAQVYSRPDQGS